MRNAVRFFKVGLASQAACNPSPPSRLLSSPVQQRSRLPRAGSLLLSQHFRFGFEAGTCSSPGSNAGGRKTMSVARPSGMFRTPTSLLFIVSGRRFCKMKLVKIFYEHAQAGVQRGFCIPRRKLFLVMFQIEIEWIIWIHVDENQVRIVHD